MMEFFKQADYFLFNLINSTWHNHVLDFLLPLFRNKYFWSPFYAFLIVYFILNFKKKGLYIILLLVVTAVIADQLSSAVIKPLVHRLRPCNVESLAGHIRILAGRSESFSFPSSHATNHFAVALFLITIFRKRFSWAVPLLLLWASSVAYAQVYVGLHFPADVASGGLLGSIIGYMMGVITMKWVKFELPLRNGPVY